jgi:lipopolysaccharide biosynthesis glycosyltransferase
MLVQKLLTAAMICTVICGLTLYNLTSFQDKTTLQRFIDHVHLYPPLRKLKYSNQRLSICPSVYVHSKYAFVTYIGINTVIENKVDWYILSACKLAHSILRHTSSIDMVMMLAMEENYQLSRYQRKMIEWSGWQICNVNFITSPNNIQNRFYDAKIFTKFHVWKMIEYKAIVCIDSDMLVINNISSLFSEIVPKMIKSNNSVAMGYDYPRKTHYRYPLINIIVNMCRVTPSNFNAGIFLLEPSINIFNQLFVNIANGQYNQFWCEQGLLNSFFVNKTYVLPFKYNANLVTKGCDPEFYKQNKADIAILHYTVAKPWMKSLWSQEYMWSCPWWNLNEECKLWDEF